MFEEQFQGEEQEFVVPPHPKYQFKLTSEQKITVKTLVIALYGPSSLFAHSLIPIKSPDARVNFQKAKQLSLADFYLLQEKQTGYLIFNGEVEKMKEVYFSQFLEQNFQVQRIVIFTHEYVNNLEKPSTVCLQHLKTSQWNQKINCNKYQNGLMGLGADVLIWGQLNRIPVRCYVGLFNDYELSRETIKQVFGCLLGKQEMNEVSQIGEKIKKYNMKKYSNNIYL